MKSRSRSIITRVIVFVVLGAIVNVAVAWGISLYGMPETLETRLVYVSRKEALVLQRYRADRWWWTRERYVQREAGGIGWMFTMANSSEQPIATPGLDVTVMVVRSGWPLMAFEGECHRKTLSYGAKTPSTKTIFHNALGSTSFVNNRWDTELVPLKLFRQGFAINTIFYAAILAVLFYGPGKVRRFVRVRRWRCPACAYLIAPGTCASGLCSECGAPLPASLVRVER
jgi:hypothetical protein